MSDSEPSRPPCPPTPHARVRRSCGALHRALGSLIQERPYERIVVKQILARAGVARSTFYAHFQDKDDLLVRSLDELLRDAERAARSQPRREQRILAFAAVLYEHIDTHRRACRSGPATDQGALHRKVEALLAERVAGQLRRELAGGWQPPAPVDLLASHIAASFTRALEASMSQQAMHDAAQADRFFRALVAPLLTP